MQGVIFDFNGTLFYDTPKHKQAWMQYGEQLLGRPVTEQEFQTSMLGRNNRLILTYLLNREPTDDELTQMGEEKEEHYRRLCLSDPKTLHLAPGAAEYLDYLKENQVPVTIATSSDLKNLDFYFAHFPLSRWFQKERCVYEDGSFPGKPHPDIYLRAAAKIGVMPKDCTVFEDALSGIAAAHAAGIGKIVAVASSAPPQLFQNVPGVTDIISRYDTFIPKNE